MVTAVSARVSRRRDDGTVAREKRNDGDDGGVLAVYYVKLDGSIIHVSMERRWTDVCLCEIPINRWMRLGIAQ